jgi:hypothetical protein
MRYRATHTGGVVSLPPGDTPPWTCVAPLMPVCLSRSQRNVHRAVAEFWTTSGRSAILSGVPKRDSTSPPFDDHPLRGKRVYRFFKLPEHADALMKGCVWITTLEACRRYENRYQGDPEEGYEHYEQGGAVTNTPEEPHFAEIAKRIRLIVGDGTTLRGNRSLLKLTDAFVLCFTERFDPATFEKTIEHKHCVAISDCAKFFDTVTNRMQQVFILTQAVCSPIIYKERAYEGMQDPPGPLGFVKPPDPYQAQQEVRMLWIVKNAGSYKPFLLNAPDVAALCTRLV